MLLSRTLLIVILTMSSISVFSEEAGEQNLFSFEPISQSANSADWDATAPWVLPNGFSQRVIADEVSSLNIYGDGCSDWLDMNTVNETGRMAGRYLYRTHEARIGSDANKYPCAPTYDRVGAAVSVVDLKTGETKIIANKLDWTALDGIRWTPWGTILFAEETTDGRLFELTLDEQDLMAGTVKAHPAVGLMAHEGIDVDKDGAIYIVDEYRGQSWGCGDIKPCGGGIYKFVPNHYGKLETGQLYMLKVMGDDGVGQGEWVGPIEPANVRLSGAKFGGTSYQRPEDLELIANTLYIAITEGSQDEHGQQKYDGRVIAIDLESMRVSNFVKAGMNAPLEIGMPGDNDFQTGFYNPDILAESPDGRLIIVEDNSQSDIWFADTDQNGDGAAEHVWLFGSLSDYEAEGTGVYFGSDAKTMFINVQHATNPDGDATWAITK